MKTRLAVGLWLVVVVACGGRVRDDEDGTVTDKRTGVIARSEQGPGGSGVQCPRDIPDRGTVCSLPDAHECRYPLCQVGTRIALCDSGSWVVRDEGSCATLPQARCPTDAPDVGSPCVSGTPDCAYGCEGGVVSYTCADGVFVSDEACNPFGS